MLIGPVGFYIRTRLDEAPVYVHAHDSAPRSASGMLARIWREHQSALWIAFGLVIASTVAQYVLNVYLPVYAVRQLKLPVSVPFTVLIITGLLRMLLTPLFGRLSDHVGRKPVLGISMALYVLTVYPLFAWLVAAPSLERLLGAEVVFAVLMAAALGPASTALAELFPTQVRATGLSISYNVATTLFGGFSPFLVTWLIDVTGNRMMPAYFVTAAMVIGLVALWPMHEGLDQASLDTSAA